MLLVLFDVHRNILSAQCCIQYETSVVDNIHMIARTDSLSLYFYSKSTLKHQVKMIFSENFINPSSISSVNCQNSVINPVVNAAENSAEWNCYSVIPQQSESTDKKNTGFEITFRLQIFNNFTIESHTSGMNETKKFKNFMKDKYEKFKTYYLVCTDCKKLLNEKPIYVQFFQMYDEKTSELAENWFCHKHDDHNSLELNGDLLYISDIYFYFHDSIIKSLKLSESKKEYKCISCSSSLSLKKKISCADFTGFFCDKVMLQESETESRDIKKYKNDIAMFSFSSIFEDILESAISCKIYLQSKVANKIESLLLWVTSQKVAQFLYHEINNDNIPNEIKFQAKETFKVLYNIVPPDSELAVKWQHDFNVDFLQISDNMMSIICQLLKETSKYFPSNQNTVNGFSFGYLPANFFPCDM